MNLSVTLYAQDLVDPRPTATLGWDEKYQVQLNGNIYGYFTAGEASLVATAWARLADDLHEREVDRLQNLPSQDSITVGEVAQTLGSV